MMELYEAETLATNLMNKHGLVTAGWTFKFDRATSRLGACHFSKKQITISKLMVLAADFDTVEQVLLHEIAHALLPVTANHGLEWKLKARSIGYRGGRTAHNPYVAPVKPPKQKTVADEKTGTTLSTGETFSTSANRSYTIQKINRTTLIAAQVDTGKLYRFSVSYALFSKARTTR